MKFHNSQNCYLCGARASETHHIFGAYNRDTSTKYGCVANLCRECHNKVHFVADRSYMTRLRQECEKWCLKTYNWSIEDFIRIFGRNYIDEI